MKTALYGRIFFGASAVLFSVIALMWRDLDTWQSLNSVWRLPFGSIVGAGFMAAQIAGGIAMPYSGTARSSSIILSVVYLLSSLACVPVRWCNLRRVLPGVPEGAGILDLDLARAIMVWISDARRI